MYTSFRVQNFRGFSDLKLDNLARVNLIAGKNNVGKTSLLEALLLHAGALSLEKLLRVSPENNRLGRSTSDRIQGAPSLNLLFTNLDTSREIILSGVHSYDPDNSEEVHAKFAVDTDGTLTHKRAYPKNGSNSYPEVLTLIYPNVTQQLIQHAGNMNIGDMPLLMSSSVVYLSAHERMSSQEMIRLFSSLERSRQADLLVEVLQVIEPRLHKLDLFYIHDFPVIYGDIQGLAEPIPLTVMGEGANRIVNVVLAIASAKGGFVAIDEAENGFHYSVLEDVWKAIGAAARQFDVQIFATTHSFECIAAAHKAFSQSEEYDFRLLRLERDPSGEIFAVTYDQELLEGTLESNFEIR